MENVAISFSLPEKQGALALKDALPHFEGIDIYIQHVESRPSKKNPGRGFDFHLQCKCRRALLPLVEERLKSAGATNITTNVEHQETQMEVEHDGWFPRTRKDLDMFAHKVLEGGKDLNADHPGFKDQEYRKRREYFADLAMNYRHGQPIPRVKYTQAEVETWGKVFNELTKLYPTHACKEHNDIFPQLAKECGYRADNIPQLDDISRFLQAHTGFQLRPVAGLLSPRDFLAGLAFRVFHSTQYIRHGSRPLYTPEPDVCHELMGHVPMLSDPTFAHFSQEIGLASLGAPDEYIAQLSTLYWFTIEFGICKQDGEKKAYGAGLLSSFGELKYCLGGDDEKPEVRPLNAFETAKQKYPITKYQPLYYLAESFANAKDQTLEFAKTIPRPFTIHYDPYTQSVKVINNKEGVQEMASDIKHNIGVLEEAIKKMAA